MNNSEITFMGELIVKYCKKFNIPIKYLFHILEDQKVTPMIRGKAMEFNVYLKLVEILPENIWSIEKLNLNAQQGKVDEDISITHKRTGIILKVESKSAVRASISDGSRSRILRTPHFSVKCHKSRSNIKLAGTTNDRYSVNDFDIIITNTTNAIYEGNTVSDSLEIIHDVKIKQMLYDHYNSTTDEELLLNCELDWRFCIPQEIGIDGYIPRTPRVKLVGDENWYSLDKLEDKLIKVVESKRKAIHASRRS